MEQSITVLLFLRQYALYKKMTQAAILIQSKFRSYNEQKKFQQSRRAAVLIQQYYRRHKECGRLKPHHRGAAALVQHKLRYSRQQPSAHYVTNVSRVVYTVIYTIIIIIMC